MEPVDPSTSSSSDSSSSSSSSSSSTAVYYAPVRSPSVSLSSRTSRSPGHSDSDINRPHVHFASRAEVHDFVRSAHEDDVPEYYRQPTDTEVSESEEEHTPAQQPEPHPQDEHLEMEPLAPTPPPPAPPAPPAPPVAFSTKAARNAVVEEESVQLTHADAGSAMAGGGHVVESEEKSRTNILDDDVLPGDASTSSSKTNEIMQKIAGNLKKNALKTGLFMDRVLRGAHSEQLQEHEHLVDDKEDEHDDAEKHKNGEETHAKKEEEKRHEHHDEVNPALRRALQHIEDPLLESMDYDNYEDNFSEAQLEKVHGWRRTFRSILFVTLRVMLTLLISFFTAMAMRFVSITIQFFFSNRVNASLSLIEDGYPAGAYFAFLFISLGCAGVAAFLVAVLAPEAKGSGVPYVNGYLNGSNFGYFFTFRIVAVKVLALAFTIGAGLTVGKEGPFVFIGGGVAYVCLRLFCWILDIGGYRRNYYTRILKGPKEERIFLAGGMAAGLAVAFNAPIAGTLFSLDGSTAFMTVPTLVRIFFCALAAQFFNAIAYDWSNEIKSHFLIPTNTSTTPQFAWQLPELIIFIIIGLFNGAAGAACTWLNMKVTKWRHHVMLNTTWKDIGKNIAEVCFFAGLTMTIWFVIPYWFPCKPLISPCYTNTTFALNNYTLTNSSTNVTTVMTNWTTIQTPNDNDRCVQAMCAEGSFNEAATIVYANAEQLSEFMMDRTLSVSEDFSTIPLMLYGIIYFTLVGFVYGMYTPGGLFVPAVIAGGVYGHCIGIWTAQLFPSLGVNPGVYGMLGAAAQLGGFTRLVLPIVLMVIEMTGDATYLLPIMITCVVAKTFADYLYPPLYPQHMALEKLPVLGEKLNPQVAKLSAKDIMQGKDKVGFIHIVDQVKNIAQLVLNSKRVSFPVVTTEGELAGVITKRALVFAVLYANCYVTEGEADESKEDGPTLHEADEKLGEWETVKGGEPYVADLRILSPEFHDQWISLHKYMDRGAVTAHPTTPTRRLQALFRRVGVSLVLIVDHQNKFLGLVTRRNLLQPPAPVPPKVDKPVPTMAVLDDSKRERSESDDSDNGESVSDSGKGRRQVDESSEHNAHGYDPQDDEDQSGPLANIQVSFAERK